jgi:hypothetical protein
MTTLALNRVRDYEVNGADFFNDLPVIASDIVYEGAAVGENASGYSRPLVAGDPFQGFAVRQVDNSAGTAGAKKVHVRSRGLVKLPVSGVNTETQGNDGTAVYASDDDTFTLTVGSNSLIGRTHRFITSGYCIVAYEALSVQI